MNQVGEEKHWRFDHYMSKAQNTTGNVTTVEQTQKAEEYEPLADWLLRNGQALAYTEPGEYREADIDEIIEDYRDLSAYQKFEKLADFYNARREVETLTKEYTVDEMLEHVEAILEHPEGNEDLQETGEEIKYTEIVSNKTGGLPDEGNEQVTWKFYTGQEDEELRGTGVKEVEGELEYIVP